MGVPACKVLIVDDDAAMRESMADVLRDEGHRVLVARDGREGIAVLRGDGEISVVLLDVMMPVMNGLEFLAEKIRDPGIAEVPVMLMTAHQQHTREVVGVTTIFTKPFDVRALLREVKRLCARTRIRRRGDAARSPPASDDTAGGSDSSAARA